MWVPLTIVTHLSDRVGVTFLYHTGGAEVTNCCAALQWKATHNREGIGAEQESVLCISLGKQRLVMGQSMLSVLHISLGENADIDPRLGQSRSVRVGCISLGENADIDLRLNTSRISCLWYSYIPIYILLSSSPSACINLIQYLLRRGWYVYILPFMGSVTNLQHFRRGQYTSLATRN